MMAMRKRRRRQRSERLERIYVRAWWLDEEGSDALLELRTKLRLWLERAREQDG
jgi:hypothetical protein